MTRYRVTFFKNVLSSDGHQFKCPQRTMEVRSAKSLEGALEAAQRQYERLDRLHDWRLHADAAEIEVISDNCKGIAPGRLG
jgi:hypothetical protein